MEKRWYQVENNTIQCYIHNSKNLEKFYSLWSEMIIMFGFSSNFALTAFHYTRSSDVLTKYAVFGWFFFFFALNFCKQNKQHLHFFPFLLLVGSKKIIILRFFFYILFF